jgi:hypothetical protein
MRTVTAPRHPRVPEGRLQSRPVVRLDAMNVVTIAICLAVGIAFHTWTFAIAVGAVYALGAMGLGAVRTARRRISKAS